jgi:hypothetical protein
VANIPLNALRLRIAKRFDTRTVFKIKHVVQSYHNSKKCVKKATKLHNRGDKYYQEVMDKFRMLKFNQYKD